MRLGTITITQDAVAGPVSGRLDGVPVTPEAHRRVRRKPNIG